MLVEHNPTRVTPSTSAAALLSDTLCRAGEGVRCRLGPGELDGGCQSSGYGCCDPLRAVLAAAASRSRRLSSARIWTAPGTSAFIIRVSLYGKNDAPGTPVCVGMSGLLDGGIPTLPLQGQSPLSAADVNPRSAAHEHRVPGASYSARNRADASFDPLVVTLMYQPHTQRAYYRYRSKTQEGGGGRERGDTHTERGPGPRGQSTPGSRPGPHSAQKQPSSQGPVNPPGPHAARTSYA